MKYLVHILRSVLLDKLILETVQFGNLIGMARLRTEVEKRIGEIYGDVSKWSSGGEILYHWHNEGNFGSSLNLSDVVKRLERNDSLVVVYLEMVPMISRGGLYDLKLEKAQNDWAKLEKEVTLLFGDKR